MTTKTTGIPAKLVAELRAKTGAGMMDCKKALEESGGDAAKAEELLRVKYAARAEKRADRAAGQGIIEIYLHFNGKVGTMVELNSETDFVANTAEFKQLAKDIAMHVAWAKPLTVTIDEVPAETLERERRVYRAQDGKTTIGDMVKALSGKTGEKISVRRFARFELGGN